jgi:hypothetical protein
VKQEATNRFLKGFFSSVLHGTGKKSQIRRKIAMGQRDFIIGNVTNVVDKDTFRIAVTRVGRHNRDLYDAEEEIVISTLKSSEIVQLIGEHPKPLLEKMLMNREVMCLISLREAKGQIKADVFIV